MSAPAAKVATRTAPPMTPPATSLFLAENSTTCWTIRPALCTRGLNPPGAVLEGESSAQAGI
ncbi:hypothetical protein ACWEO1_16830 [Kitasatospora cineracea]